MASPIQITNAQLEAADRIYDSWADWILNDTSLDQLAEIDRQFEDKKNCVIKCAALNSLYSTNLSSDQIILLSEGIFAARSECLRDLDSAATLVNKIAGLLGRPFVTSFASKFCHFFIDSQKFHIYDSRAVRTCKIHIGKYHQPTRNCPKTYEIFLESLRRITSSDFPCRSLDRYLWLVGSIANYLEANSNNDPYEVAEERPLGFRAWISKRDETKRKNIEALLPDEPTFEGWKESLRYTVN